MGRPSLYRPEYCEALKKHMAKGYSFETFAAEIGTHRDTLYAWCKTLKDFSDARNEAFDLNLRFWEQLGLQGATGQLRRISKEEPVIENGVPVLDSDGKVLMRREYEPATFGQAVWIFNMKNRHRWRDRVENVGDPGGDKGKPYATASEAELDRKIQEHVDDMQPSIPEARLKPMGEAW